MKRSCVVLSLINICKLYKQNNSDICVLRDVTMHVKSGEFVTITGASGSGKSTLLHIAGLLDKPDSGNVMLGDIYDSNNCTMYSKRRARQVVGFVYQKYHLLQDFTVRENVALPMLLVNGDTKCALYQADVILDKLQLLNKAYNMPSELSGGEQQRVAIARSLVTNPKLLLADEPTGNLDVDTAHGVLNLLINAIQSGTALVLVTHDKGIAARGNSKYELTGCALVCTN